MEENDMMNCPISDENKIKSVLAEVFGDAKYKIKIISSFFNKLRVGVVYWDYLPEKEVMRMIGNKLPGVEILISRDYDLETMKNALMEMCDNDEHVWCYDLYNTPFHASPLDIASAWLADKRIKYSTQGRRLVVEDKVEMMSWE